MKEKDWCDTCKEPWASEQCNTCKYGYGKENNYKPMTNADRIRAMSDEELALILSVRHYCPLKRMNKCSFYFSKDDGCSQCWLDWLKAPVEVQDGT